jgi:hypothetical protein
MNAAGREDSMKGLLGLAIGSILLAAGAARAVPPAPGQHFDCSDGGDTSCAADDPGCVSNSKGHLACSSKINSALAKSVLAATICHIDQAEKRMKGASENGAGQSEENCEENPGNSAKGKLDKRLAAVADQGICDKPQVDGAAAQEAVLFGSGPGSLDGQNGLIFCDSSSGALIIGDDDPGFVPATADIFKCEVTVAKALVKLVAAGAKCHDNMNKVLFKLRDFDEETCEGTDPIRFRGALDKFNKVRDKLVAQGICPSCMDGAAMDALAASVISQLDAANDDVYPCGLAP